MNPTNIEIRRGKVFSQLGSTPQQWDYLGGCHFNHSHCELCDTEIWWQYPLTNTHTKRTLLVGSECIKYFAEAFLGNGLDRILLSLKESYRAEKRDVIAKKTLEWAAADPHHQEIINFLRDEKSYTYFRVVQVGDRKYSTSRYRASLKRKGYLRPDEVAEVSPNMLAWVADRGEQVCCGQSGAAG
jgi:hypothetical protein